MVVKKSMKNNLYIITGGSNGFGKSLVLNLIAKNHTVISISRSSIELKSFLNNSAVNNSAVKNSVVKNKKLIQIKIDFTKKFQNQLNKILARTILKLNKADFENIILINNAAVIGPIDQIQELDEYDIIQHNQINLNTPIIMSQIFLKIFKKVKNSKLIIQITSGAALSPIIGWSMYCSSKAGLNMFNAVMAEQFKNDKSFKCIGYSPGIMDTNMQENIRSVNLKQFPDLSDFKKYKKEKKLRHPDVVALDLLNKISHFSKIKSGFIYRVG